MCLALYLFLYAFSVVCGNKNTKHLPGQAAAQPASAEQKDQGTQFLETMSRMFNTALNAKRNALDELERKNNKKKFWKKVPANKAAIDFFIQEQRANIVECQRLEPIYNPATVALATGEHEFAFWQRYETLMEGLEGKK